MHSSAFLSMEFTTAALRGDVKPNVHTCYRRVACKPWHMYSATLIVLGSVTDFGIFGSLKWGSEEEKKKVLVITSESLPVYHCFTIGISASASHHLISEVVRKSQRSLGYSNKPNISCCHQLSHRVVLPCSPPPSPPFGFVFSAGSE